MLFTYVAPSAFSPLDLPNLALWLDSSDTSTITQSGGSVSIWADKSGNSYNATESIGVQQPQTGTRTVNGLNAIEFNGTGTGFDLPSGLYDIGAGANTVYAVCATDDTSKSQRILGGAAGGNRYGPGLNLNGTGRIEMLNGAFSNSAQINLGLNTAARIVTGRRNGTTLEVRNNNGTFNSNSLAVNSTCSAIQVGRYTPTSSQFDGVICEIVAVRRYVSGDEDSNVISYLSQKWGIT